MIIGINASFLRKQETGIGQVTTNFLKKLVEFEVSNFKYENNKKLEFILYLEEDIDLNLPDGFRKKVCLPPYKRDDLIRKIWWEKFLLPRFAREDRCDVFLSLYQSPTIMPKIIPHIVVTHDIIPRLFPQYLNNWRKRMYQGMVEGALRHADRIIAVSHQTEKDLINHLGIDAKKITVSYIDVDEIYKKEVGRKKNEEILKKYKLKAGYIYAGGGLEVRKNIENVLRAYKILFDQYGYGGKIPKLVISGKLMPGLAPLITDIEQLVEGLRLSKQVAILGRVPQEDLPALYRNAVLFAYPSLYEGFGLPVLEAMNQGLPVIASKTSSLPEVGSDSVLYCDPLSVDDLAMVMKNVLMNDHMQIALSLKGKERATHFSWEKFVKKTINIVNSL